MGNTPEHIRLREDHLREKNWKRWGPYLAERQWATVREDYSPDGDAWRYFPHDHARSRTYRWGEDGLLGITDREGRLCFALSLWNGCDPFLKERLFGLGNHEGNHGEDVKEYYFYLDSTPTHSYMKALYKYPQREFPYERLISENRLRGKHEPEFELLDTGIFSDNRYFDIFAEYCKESPNDVLIRITAVNRGPEDCVLHIAPTVWFRNTWSWGRTGEGYWPKPIILQESPDMLLAEHASLGRFHFCADAGPHGELPQFLFTDNESNLSRLYGVENPHPFLKDAFHDFIVYRNEHVLCPQKVGTKAAAYYALDIPAATGKVLRLRLFAEGEAPQRPFDETFEHTFEQRKSEADAFYEDILPRNLSPEECRILRQAYAGLLWSKQLYHFSIADWLEGDPAQPTPPPERRLARNSDWIHLYNRDVLSMPDKWEYPWYATWDLAFHMIPFSQIDPFFAKDQLILLLREWYMHPNGQLPAYEWDLFDVNPPVHAWAAWRVYKITGPRGERDRNFLARVFHKLLLNFTWWVNRKDMDGHHLFSGGFLGLDNIGVFDRSKPLPTGGHLEQADGTAWMAFFCLTMLSMALELAKWDSSYEDLASKFFEHFIAIADSINYFNGSGLWDEKDGFYYDFIHRDGEYAALRTRSLVGLIPLIGTEVIEDEIIQSLPGFRKRMQWFLDNRKDLTSLSTCMAKQEVELGHRRRLLAVPSRERLVRALKYVLDENELLSAYGIRSLSKIHQKEPFGCRVGGDTVRVEYVPGESDSYAFGGNSNWRGPVWFPINYLFIEALERYHHFYGDTLKVECPTGSGKWMNLSEVASELSRRLASIYLPGLDGRSPWCGSSVQFAKDPFWSDYLLFYEYFHGETGRGLGASHQTGWTALITRLIEGLSEVQRTTSAR